MKIKQLLIAPTMSGYLRDSSNYPFFYFPILKSGWFIIIHSTIWKSWPSVFSIPYL